LLITAVGNEYSLASSDQRITIQLNGRTRAVDEKFNKHIYFGTEDFVANISYTGSARWREGKQQLRLYDLISEAVASLIVERPSLSKMCMHVVMHLLAKMTGPAFDKSPAHFELHILSRDKRIPANAITVISTFRTEAPWSDDTGMIYDWDFGSLRMFMKILVDDETEVIFGGAEHAVSADDRSLIGQAVHAGADAFQCARAMARIVEKAAAKTELIGKKAVSIAIPANGLVDTNHWGDEGAGIVAYLPRMVMSNGIIWGPSIFPVELGIISGGQLPKHSLFFKSIVHRQYKRRLRRRLFRYRKGPLIPGIMGLLSLMLFGSVPEGYDDFGLRAGEAELPGL